MPGNWMPKPAAQLAPMPWAESGRRAVRIGRHNARFTPSMTRTWPNPGSRPVVDAVFRQSHNQWRAGRPGKALHEPVDGAPAKSVNLRQISFWVGTIKLSEANPAGGLGDADARHPFGKVTETDRAPPIWLSDSMNVAICHIKAFKDIIRPCGT